MPRNLLVADDSITIQKVIGITFAGEDFRVVAVDNGADALAKAREIRPDIILADVVMPRKNGYELCEAVKNDPELRHIPVLLLAGTFEAFDDTRARAAFADGHIAKPFETQALIAKVKEVLAHTGARSVQTDRAAEPAVPVTPTSPMGGDTGPRAGAAQTRQPEREVDTRVAELGSGTEARPAVSIEAPVPRVPAPRMTRDEVTPSPRAASEEGAIAHGAKAGGGSNEGNVPRPPSPPPEIDWAQLGLESDVGVGVPSPPEPSPLPRDAAGMAAAVIPRPSPEKDAPSSVRDPRASQGTAEAEPEFEPRVGNEELLRYGDPVDLAELQTIDRPLSHAAEGKPATAVAPVHSDGGERQLREALSRASQEVIERIAWEIVPPLAEAIIREHVDRLIKDRKP